MGKSQFNSPIIQGTSPENQVENSYSKTGPMDEAASQVFANPPFLSILIAPYQVIYLRLTLDGPG
jgi:hypothetical protein